MGPSARRAQGETVRTLTKHEIDRRIEEMVSEVVGHRDGRALDDGETLRPRWIAAGELVRRVKPFIVLN